MRRFDYTSYATPDDPKKLRQQTQGKFRTDAATFRDVAQAFAGDESSIEGATDASMSMAKQGRLADGWRLPPTVNGQRVCPDRQSKDSGRMQRDFPREPGRG